MKRAKTLNSFLSFSSLIFSAVVLMMTVSCSKETTDVPIDEEQIIPPAEEEAPKSDDCTDKADYVFVEKDGLVNVQFEEAIFDAQWKLSTDGDALSGKGYMVWTGEQSLGNPGLGATSFKIKIENTGVYRFIWKSAVKMGNSGTDHNDTWLRFADASDFYAKNGESVVYPKDTGKTPNPEGASKDGWFKVYRSGNDLDFKWQATTFDNNGHSVYVQFDQAGIYTMEVSARSSGHGIDKFVLFNDAYSQADITAETLPLSAISCSD